jgi:hypothetical protein
LIRSERTDSNGISVVHVEVEGVALELRRGCDDPVVDGAGESRKRDTVYSGKSMGGGVELAGGVVVVLGGNETLVLWAGIRSPKTRSAGTIMHLFEVREEAVPGPTLVSGEGCPPIKLLRRATSVDHIIWDWSSFRLKTLGSTMGRLTDGT